MADTLNPPIAPAEPNQIPAMPATLDEARAMARQRFKSRLDAGEKVGECACGDETEQIAATSPDARRVTGIRFIDSGRTYYFDPLSYELAVGDWVVVETSRGKEAGRVILAPHQVRQSSLQGELKPILRMLSAADIERMNQYRREAANAIRVFNQKIREHALPMKPVNAEYNFDGSYLLFNFTASDRVDFRELAKDLSAHFRCRVELRQVGPRDEARLLGGVGRCGRTLCCSSWLPVYPEISMNMAKTQDLPLNPSKVSGVCGRLLCCLSYENEQYKQMKASMPRLGQIIETPGGPGMVISMQILKDLITVRLGQDNTDHVFTAAELGMRRAEPTPPPAVPAPPRPAAAVVTSVTAPVETVASGESEVGDGVEDDEGPESTEGGDGPERTGRRRRRRGRGGRRRSEGGPPAAQS